MPLSLTLAQQYHKALTKDGRAWWHARGISDSAIDRFLLGYCASCPTAYNPDDSSWSTPSYTIPIFADGALVNIRHRLISPLDPGDKYRPQKTGLGAHLFGIDDIDAEATDILVVEGEIKRIVLLDNGFDYLMPIVTLTCGASGWMKQVGDRYIPALDRFQRVFVLFDPDAHAVAEQTARRFGRRGYVVQLPDKVDDFIIAGGSDALLEISKQIDSAISPFSLNYWKEQMEHERISGDRPAFVAWEP
jgi:hypothetical protein